jgi:uncharacterized protein YecE (DUF72 family)
MLFLPSTCVIIGNEWVDSLFIRELTFLKVTPNDFTFHFKAFQLFTSHSCEVAQLPRSIRDDLPEQLQIKERISKKDLSNGMLEKLWDLFDSAVGPIFNAKKMGVVLFQYHSAFAPTDENISWILDCQKLMNRNKQYQMAVEFRNRSWFGPTFPRIIKLLRDHQICLTIVDEPMSEEEAGIPGTKNKESNKIFPIFMTVTHSLFLYIRIHRRTGTNRLLTEQQLTDWKARIFDLPSHLTVWMLWNTNHADQSIINATKMAQLLGPEISVSTEKKSGLMNFLQKKEKGEEKEEEKLEFIKGEKEEPPKKKQKAEIIQKEPKGTLLHFFQKKK